MLKRIEKKILHHKILKGSISISISMESFSLPSSQRPFESYDDATAASVVVNQRWSVSGTWEAEPLKILRCHLIAKYKRESQ